MSDSIENGRMIRLSSVTKTYLKHGREVRALDGIDLDVARGELVAVAGPSGGGKTTLLFTAGAMLRPQSGRAEVDGRSLYELSAPERTAFRARTIGFVFQTFCLIPYLTVIENVLFGISPRSRGASRRANALLDELGLAERAAHLPRELSAGESQRTALARALVRDPSVILADEPTGNLDSANAGKVLGILQSFRNQGGTVILVTHDRSALALADRVVHLRAGRIEAAGGA